MTSIFKASKPAPVEATPLPEPLPPTPTRSDTETASLAETQRRKYSTNSSGRASTFLTAGGTDTGSAAVRFLGGAART